MVEASVVARLLGIRLLRLTAHVTLMPAKFEPISYLERDTRLPSPALAVEPVEAGTLNDAANLLAHALRTIRETSRTKR